MAQVAFNTQNKKFLAEFDQSLTAQMIIKSLPFEGVISVWGDEIYVDTGIQASDLHATMEVNVGDVGYRHEEKRLCVFFGRTPASTSDRPVPAFPVVVIGRILCPPEELRCIKAGDTIKILLNEEKPQIPAASAGDRKLTQAEIDELVKKLLAAKSAGQSAKRA
ncbi:MAG TPA: cyclophilin-like fold protein [Candidatus Omnitrophota bacterium]|nr:hypothetical protein [Candidatus Omnitrophota bacterium]HNQ49854.1 cyclophilin-like fold protein [Candidatus Omnitrophota bacterium]HQQ06630.1 cyclophilin-like fold protein [Candidatus Omnitrophota bacterium]